MKWEPIETAPKDGTWILAVARGFVPAVAKWEPGWRKGGSFEFVEVETFANDDHWQEYVDTTDPWRPTHWMPLPEPPESP